MFCANVRLLICILASLWQSLNGGICSLRGKTVACERLTLKPDNKQIVF